MFWIQSGISSNVNPNFHRGAQKVSKSSITYKTLSTIDFPFDLLNIYCILKRYHG